MFSEKEKLTVLQQMIYMHHTDDSLSQSEQDQSSTGESKGNRLKGVGLHWTDLKFIPHLSRWPAVVCPQTIGEKEHSHSKARTV